MKKAAPADKSLELRKEGLQLTAPLKSSITTLIVNTPSDYAKADALLLRVRANRAQWKARMAEILDPLEESKKAAAKAYKSAEGLFNEIDGPMQDLELQVKERMRAFKITEARLLAEAEEKRQKEQQELEKQLKEKEQAEARAKTPAMQNRILEVKAKLQQAIADKKSEEPTAPIKASGSTARTVKKYRITDVAKFLRHAANSDTLNGLLQVNAGQMQAYFRLEADKLQPGEWMPGVEIYEDITIAGR